MIAPNIFQPRNDWNVRQLSCDVYTPKGLNFNTMFVNFLASVIREEMGVDPLKQQTRRIRNLVISRQLFMVLLTKYTEATYSKASSLVGKDHATVNYAKKTIDDLYETDKLFRMSFDRIEKKVIDYIKS